jgi:hypothetical protein
MSVTEVLSAKAQSISLEIPDRAVSLVTAAQAELAVQAATDPDQCAGYFPAFAPDQHLVHAIELANTIPEITVDDTTLGFNFLRYSARQQPQLHGMHLDTDAATAVTGPAMEQQHGREVWRLLLNLHPLLARDVYIAPDVSTSKLDCEYRDGYLAVVGGLDTGDIQTITLPQRQGATVAGLLFCANQVPHMGSDSRGGHFVAGYGMERLL